MFSKRKFKWTYRTELIMKNPNTVVLHVGINILNGGESEAIAEDLLEKYFRI